MFSKSVEFYDEIVKEFKDYDKECRDIDKRIKSINPEAKTILDVACGTGEHALILSRDYGYEVDGIDLEEGFIELASKKCPEGRFEVADMTDFELDRKYDVVTCLFSAIGYAGTLEKTSKAIGCFKDHLNEDGVMLVEPWIDPREFENGNSFLRTVDRDGFKAARIGRSEVFGNISRVTFDYLVVVKDEVYRETEVHELVLLSREELLGCFEENGLDYEYDDVGLMDRWLSDGQEVRSDQVIKWLSGQVNKWLKRESVLHSLVSEKSYVCRRYRHPKRPACIG